MKHVKIIGSGTCVPEHIVKNETITHDIDTTDKWVENNVGIKERRIADIDDTTVSLGAGAVQSAMEEAMIWGNDVDLLIVATTTPEQLSPSTACIIKDKLGLTNAVAFDVSAVCSGFLFGVSIAEQYISSGMFKNAIVVGVDLFSKITDWNHKHSVFFGDGAGAVVLQRSDIQGFLGFKLYSDSVDRAGFYCNHGEKFTMNARSVYDTATRVLPVAIKGVLDKCGMTIDDVDYFVPHQPSKRILLDVAKTIGLPTKKVMMNMDRYANTVAGTIPILYDEVKYRFKERDIILFAAIGSGWTYGSAIYIV